MKRHPILRAFVFLLLMTGAYLSLTPASNYIVFSVLKLKQSDLLTEAIRFFLYEAPKVLLLLVAVVFAVGTARTYFSPERTRSILNNKPLFLGNVLASLLGVITPFCSCSAVPLFMGFVQTGIPLGVTFSFLIAAPMINEVALVLLFGLFGWQTALLYVSTGLGIAVISGYVIGRLKAERFVEDWVYKMKTPEPNSVEIKLTLGGRLEIGSETVKEIFAKVYLYILIGIGVGAGIHGYVPENFMAGIMGKSDWWSVPVAVLIGIPLYSNAAGIIPIVQALLGKGAALGTSLAFMMSVVGLSLPETIILRKVLRLPLIFIFVSVVAVGIIIVGYLFNFIY